MTTDACVHWVARRVKCYVIYLFFPDGQSVHLPQDTDPYLCVVLIERPVDADYRWDASKALVATGCRYMMAWGQECSLWDDSVDWACLERFDYGEVPADHFVMTTWHENETMLEVFEFAKRHARLSYDDKPLDTVVVLDLGRNPREAYIRDLYENADR